MEGITVHCMVRNEPFVSYAIKSVYQYVDKILLYDTGSNDEHTLQDIADLCSADTEKKIDFRSVPIEYDETPWTVGTSRQLAKANTGKRGKWWVRQKMIDDTRTKYFMILDGDEVYYSDIMQRIQETIDDWPKDKICAFIPLLWFVDLSHTFKLSKSGRIFVTDKIGMTKYSPGEIHTNKSTGKKLHLSMPECFEISNISHYAHYERLLKPWRRKVKPEDIFTFLGRLPEIIEDDFTIARRFLSAGPCKQFSS